AKALTAACDEFASYEALPGVELQPKAEPQKRTKRGKQAGGASAELGRDAGASSNAEAGSSNIAVVSGTDRDETDALDIEEAEFDDEPEVSVTGLLIRALWLSQDKDDSGWLYSSAVKQQMRRMDPSFN